MNTNPLSLASAPLSTPPQSAPGRRPKLKLALLGALGVLLVTLLAGAAWLLHLIWWTVPFLQETGLLVWVAAMVLALAVTVLLTGLKFRQAWRRSSARTAPVWVMLAAAIALGGWLWHRGYGIDPSCHWLNEFLASYFGYAFLAERRPERKPVIALFGRPSQARPKHTTLADFERLYFLVDDYGWYQGMFERRIQEMYPQAGLQFLKDLKRVLPRTAPIPEGVAIPDPVVNRIAPEVVVERLEAIAPGFQAWAAGFGKQKH